MAKQNSKWFIKTRWSYLPASREGWLLYIPYLAYVIGVLVFVFENNDKLWVGLFTVLPNWIAAAVILQWLAEHRS